MSEESFRRFQLAERVWTRGKAARGPGKRKMQVGRIVGGIGKRVCHPYLCLLFDVLALALHLANHSTGVHEALVDDGTGHPSLRLDRLQRHPMCCDPTNPRRSHTGCCSQGGGGGECLCSSRKDSEDPWEQASTGHHPADADGKSQV